MNLRAETRSMKERKKIESKAPGLGGEKENGEEREGRGGDSDRMNTDRFYMKRRLFGKVTHCRRLVVIWAPCCHRSLVQMITAST